ncbi:hypothetical protein DTO282F9_1219 [Paecilomyces variotii]|nr:hypothetical protein DTO282F9_1219 [Paecilomyces variotii]
MWPPRSTLARATRLRNLPTATALTPRLCCRSKYTFAADATRLRSLNSSSHRPTSDQSWRQCARAVQTRWITEAYIQRQKDMEKQWAEYAKEIRAGKRKSFVDVLEERELLHDVVGERDVLKKLFIEKRVGLYAGVDPTAPSLHVGHMLPFMVLAWAYVHGLPVHFLLGGATSRIGDPTGRLQGREAQQNSVRKANMANMHMQLKKLGASIEKYGIRHGHEKQQYVWKRALVNNNTWWHKISFYEVLRDLGQHIRLGPMLGRDTVKTRLTKGDGMSFAEFSYPLMQAWDWWTLFKKGVQVQVGGADQYGNILFGMDAVKAISKNTAIEIERKSLDDDMEKPIGLTTPLLTTSSGAKFGKSAGNAIWLDKDMTTTFELYQFFVRTADADVERYLKMFTFVPIPEIQKIMEEHVKEPSRRVAQHRLAREFVELIHGEEDADATVQQHRQLFGSQSSPPGPVTEPALKIDPSVLETGATRSPSAGFDNMQSGNKHAPQTHFGNMPAPRITLPRSLVYNQPLNRVLWSAGLVSSKSEGQRIIANKGAYVGSRAGDTGEMSDDLSFTPIKTWPAEKTQEFIIGGDLLILKLGKWKFKMVQIISDEEFRERGLTARGWQEVEQEAQDQAKKEEREARKEARAGKPETIIESSGAEVSETK